MSALCEAVCGVRIEQFFRFVNAALNIGDRFGGEVVQMARTDFLTELQQETEDDLQTVTHLLALLSLADRGGAPVCTPACFSLRGVSLAIQPGAFFPPAPIRAARRWAGAEGPLG